MWRAAEASAYLRAPLELVYPILTNYDLYSSWVPDITSSRLLAREGDLAIAEFVCPRYGRGKFLLELIETPATAISYSRIDHHRVEMTGGWRLEETQSGDRVVAHADLRLDGRPHEIFLRRAMRDVLERTLEGLTERVTQIEAALETGAVPPGELILDLNHVGEKLVVRLRDRVYELSRSRMQEEK